MIDDKSEPGSWVRELLCYPDPMLRALGVTREELKKVERLLNRLEVIELGDEGELTLRG